MIHRLSILFDSDTGTRTGTNLFIRPAALQNNPVPDAGQSRGSSRANAAVS
jgi:hypothetical protein